MAAVIAPVLKYKAPRYRVWEWTPLANGDSGGPINLEDFADITVKMYGTPGAGGAVTILGALNLPLETADAGTALEEEAGIPLILLTADRFATPRNAPLSLWPSVTAGDGTTSLTVRAVIRR
jgi:hypothetical protein